MRCVPRFTRGAEVHTSAIPKAALNIIPALGLGWKKRDNVWLKKAIADSATTKRKTTNPRCTRKYRALRRSRTGISITRCFTTAYPKESGYSAQMITRIVFTQNEGRYSVESIGEI